MILKKVSYSKNHKEISGMTRAAISNRESPWSGPSSFYKTLKSVELANVPNAMQGTGRE